MTFLPHAAMLGSGYLTVALNGDLVDPARLDRKLYIVRAGNPVDTSKVGPLRFDDPLLKVANPSVAHYLRDLPIKLTGVPLPIDDVEVRIGPLTLSNSFRPYSLLMTDTGIVVPERMLTMADGTYPVTVVIPSKGNIASGTPITLLPLSIPGPKEQVYPGDTITFDGYHSDVYVMVNGVRYSKGDPAHGIWQDGMNDRMKLGPLVSLAAGTTKVSFMLVSNDRVVGVSSMNASQSRTEDLTWVPQQQYAGKIIEVTHPTIGPSFELESCTISGAYSTVLSTSQTKAQILLGPDVRSEGFVVLTFTDRTDRSKVVVTSRSTFVPLIRTPPPPPVVPVRNLNIKISVPAVWVRAGNEADTYTGVEKIELDLTGFNYDTSLVQTNIEYWSLKKSSYNDRTTTDSTVGSAVVITASKYVTSVSGDRFFSYIQTNHNTNWNKHSKLRLVLADLGPAIDRSYGVSTISLTGESAFNAIRSFAYYSSDQQDGSGYDVWSSLTFQALAPSLASQCSITLTFSQ
ncbi:MAG: hypothetical protein EHM43_11930 [Ignavibacteriae bacterium]|nr:MAG: hypothetical protein EHM43_11930 [Ignavibacteriota bacterium]